MASMYEELLNTPHAHWNCCHQKHGEHVEKWETAYYWKLQNDAAAMEKTEWHFLKQLNTELA
jgi:hypothetical protein